MHKYYSESVMTDKANAIREILKLENTEENKMLPSEMAEKLYSFGEDPTLIFEMNGVDLITDNTVAEFQGAFYFFGAGVNNTGAGVYNKDEYETSGLDYNKYNKVEITFKITELSQIDTLCNIFTFPNDRNNPNRPSFPFVKGTYNATDGLTLYFRFNKNGDAYSAETITVEHAEDKDIKIILTYGSSIVDVYSNNVLIASLPALGSLAYNVYPYYYILLNTARNYTVGLFNDNLRYVCDEKWEYLKMCYIKGGS